MHIRYAKDKLRRKGFTCNSLVISFGTSLPQTDMRDGKGSKNKSYVYEKEYVKVSDLYCLVKEKKQTVTKEKRTSFSRVIEGKIDSLHI